MKITISQLAAKIGVTPFTIKRWYEFYQDLDEEERMVLSKEYNMPLLPKYETVGSRGDRIWDEEDTGLLAEFKSWVPPTKRGIFQKYKKEREN